MSERDRDYAGSGDPRLDEDKPHGGTNLPGTPGYESEAAFRHREASDATIKEIRTNQMAPGPLREPVDEPQFEPDILPMDGSDTPHQSG